MLVLLSCENQSNKRQPKIDTLIESLEKGDLAADQSLARIDSILNVSIQTDYKTGIAKGYSLKGTFYYSQKDFQNAYSYYKSAIKFAETENNYEQLGIDYENLGRVYNRLKNSDSSIYAFKKSVEVRKEIKDSTGLGVAYHNTGFIFWNETQYDSAIVYFEKALEIRKNLHNKEHLSSTTNNLGTIYYQWGIYDKALEYYFQALKLNREINIGKNIAVNLINIGLVYKETEKSTEAIKYFKESLPYALNSKDPETLGYAYNSLGNAFLKTNKDSSIYYFTKSLEEYKAKGFIGGEIISLKGFAQNYIIEKNYEEAKKYFFEILRIAKENNNPLRIAESKMFLGEIYLAQNNLEKAKEYCLESIKLSEELTLKTFLRDSYKTLSSVYEKLGNSSEALYSLKEYEKYYFEINNESTKRKIDDLKSQFEFEKYMRAIQAQQHETEKQKFYLSAATLLLFFAITIATVLFRSNRKREKINNLLNQKNELIEGQSKELEIKNEELVESNEAKDKLFSIIAHDLKNPFSILLNYSYFLKEEYHHLTEKERTEFVSGIYKTITKTYELLENLLNLSASRTGKISFHPVNIGLADVIDNIISLFTLQTKEKGISLINNISKELKIHADKYMIEIIFRNLINNAVKYTGNSGTIEISSTEKNGSVCITVKDNGVGIDEKSLENIFNINVIKSQMGTKGEKGTGLGLGLCKEFVEKNSGNLNVESELNKGSKFIVCLPFQK